MDKIERKLRTFYALEPMERWFHLLVVADECEEMGDKELAEALQQLEEERLFPNVRFESKIEEGVLLFNMGQSDLFERTLIDAIRMWSRDRRAGTMISLFPERQLLKAPRLRCEERISPYSREYQTQKSRMAKDRLDTPHG